jgi:phage tail sheath protein FI
MLRNFIVLLSSDVSVRNMIATVQEIAFAFQKLVNLSNNNYVGTIVKGKLDG